MSHARLGAGVRVQANRKKLRSLWDSSAARKHKGVTIFIGETNVSQECTDAALWDRRRTWGQKCESLTTVEIAQMKRRLRNEFVAGKIAWAEGQSR